MKPQMLKIMGINSFNEMQQLDFSKILEKGMFGIFGNTGSGKSTILDCITLALYGKIVRYDGKNGNGDFLNLNVNNGKVEFIFSVKNGKEEIFYEVVRQFKRNSKGKINLDLIRLSILKSDEKEIIADKNKEVEDKIVNIIGLSYSDFTKAVVLPQGKFSDFLMLENSDKVKMLQRIFSLEKYGDILKDKINKKRSKQESLINGLKKEIEIYGNISLDNIEEEKNILKENEQTLNNINIELKEIEEKEKYFNNVLKLKEDLLFYNEKLQNLIPYESTILDFEKNLNLILEAEKIALYILELDNIVEENKININNLNILKEKFENIQNDYSSIEKQYNFYKNKKEEEKPKLDKIKQDLQQCILLIDEKNILERDIFNINDNLKNITKEKEVYLSKIINIKKEKEFLLKQIDDIVKFNEENKLNISFKEDLKNAIDLKDKEISINEKIEHLKENLNVYDNNIKENNLNIETLEKDILNINNTIKNIIITNINNLQQKIQENEKIIESTLNENLSIEEKIDKLNIQIKIQENKEVLKDLLENLKENKPCPLCGAIEHPNPVKIVLDNIINILNSDKLKNENKLKENLEYINDLKLKNNLLYKNIEDIKIISKKYNIESYENIISEFIFNENDILKNIYNYENKLNKLNEQLNTIKISNENIINLKEEKNKELNNNNILLLNLKNELDNYTKKLNTNNFYEQYELILNIEIKINKNNENYLNINKKLVFLDKENIEISNSITNLEKEEILLKTKKKEKESNILDINDKIKTLSYNEEPKEYIITIEKNINDILENEQKYKILLDKILEEKFNIEKNINDIEIKLKINNESINKKSDYIDVFLKNSNFENKSQILEIYNNKDKKQFYEEKIKSYREKFDDYNYNIKRLEKEFEKLNLDKNLDLIKVKNNIENIIIKKQDLNIKNSEIIKNITTLKISITQKQETFKKIENITKIIKEEEIKFDLLKELSDLNKGGAFVEYVANRQLKHIVIDASKRLFNMSQSKYSLELLEGSFVIKDNYNGGIIRSPRSLSGGEVFMASLSLALSLSSKIQLKNKAPLEVFFLDEGFGTLDNNTLDIVINTLEQLQTSNISVGIITHVEEIKNRVQNKINVIATENGSKINI